MKKTIFILIAATLAVLLTACAPSAPAQPEVDLTQMSSTMKYSEVYNMLTTPENYIGKQVKMAGTFAVYEGENRSYYACVIADASACCSQGIEFVLGGDAAYPEDYPAVGEYITVTGVFDSYTEGALKYCQLIEAEII